MKTPVKLQKLKQRIVHFYEQNTNLSQALFVLVTSMCIYLYSNYQDRETHVYHYKKNIDLKGGKVVGNSKVIYERKAKIHAKKIEMLEKSIKAINNSVEKIDARILELYEYRKQKENPPQEKEKKEGLTPNTSRPEAKQEQIKDEKQTEKASDQPEQEQVTFSTPPHQLRAGQVAQRKSLKSYEGVRPVGSVKKRRGPTIRRRFHKGPSTISFPVESNKKPERMEVKLPAGSFLRARILTGVEASEDRPLPVLLQSDYSFIGPNNSRIDLSGCFILAKSKGNLSTERIEMKVNKISCLSTKTGRMFERDLNGYVADNQDTGFGVIGEVNSKQDRTAAMAMLSSVVQGIGNAIQQGQTTNQVNALGGSSSIVTGDQAKHMVAGGISNSAQLVTNWYLRHAQGLRPTINIAASKKVWIVINETVSLPNWYFRKSTTKNTPGSYSYLSRFND